MTHANDNAIVIVPDVEDVKNVDVVDEELKHQNDALDEALEESFPASDPIAISFTKAKAFFSRLA